MEGEMCTSMCQIRPPQKVKKNTVNLFCDTKALTEVSKRIGPTSDIWTSAGWPGRFRRFAAVRPRVAGDRDAGAFIGGEQHWINQNTV